jgi:branched-chain amino acid transport system substrate-binding protein
VPGRSATRPRTRVAGRLAAGALAVLALAAGTAACGGDGEGEGNDSFDLVIGNLVPLRGDLAEFGPAGRKAADLALAQARRAVNRTGADIEVEVSHADSETQEQAALLAGRRLVRDRGADCLVGDWAAAGTFSTGIEVAVKREVPLISPASTNFDIAGIDDRGYVFRTAPPDQVQVLGLANLIADEVGRKATVSLAARNDAYGVEFAEKFEQAWRERGGRVADPVLYDPTKPAFGAEARRIVSGEPDAYVIVDFPDSYAKLGVTLAKTGRFDASRLFVSDTLGIDDILERDVPADAIVGALGLRPGRPASGPPGTAFERLYAARGGAPRERVGFEAQAFDATVLCFLGAVAAGSANGAAIADRLQAVSGPPGGKYDWRQLPQAVEALQAGEEIDYEGASGPIDFDDDGEPAAASYEVFEQAEDGLRITGALNAGR